jgi:hypothetical protein
MDPLAIASLAEGGIGLAKTLFGLGDTPMPTRPKYTMPSEINEILQLEKSLGSTDLPGYDKLQGKIAGGTAKGAQRIGQVSSDSSQAISAISGLYSKEMSERADLDVKNAMYKVGRQEAIARALQTKADYKDKEWNWNEAMKYQDQYNQAMADKGAKNDLLGSGLSDITGALSGYGSGKLWEKALGLGKTSTGSSGGMGDTSPDSSSTSSMTDLPTT